LDGATRTEGCSAQYEEYSVREVLERIKGGAVMEDRSPLKEAMDCEGVSVSHWSVAMVVRSHLQKAGP